MKSQRSAIVELHRAGKSAPEILKAFKFPKTRRSFVYRTIQRYKETGSVKDRARSDRPRTATTQKMKESPEVYEEMAAELEISREIVRRVVKRDLGLSPLKGKNDSKEVARCCVGSQLMVLTMLRSLTRKYLPWNKLSIVKMIEFSLGVSWQYLRTSKTSAELENLRLSWSGQECLQKGKPL